MKIGFTAPRVEGQAQVIRAAQLVADVEADTITYVEAHGTATPLGDPIEVAALTKAFRESTDRRGFCLLGSVKTNIGHADAAAGVAGFIKTVLALEHGLIPATLHFRRPNPQLELETSPFAVNTTLTEWRTAGFPRRAGVSAFGIGGTNAHAILEEPSPRHSDTSGPHHMLTLSARTRPALEEATSRLAQHLRSHPEVPLAEVAWTLQVGRTAHPHRRILVAESPEDAVQALGAADAARVITSERVPSERPVVFMFPGQGGQHVGMGRELYETDPTFRQEVDRASDMATPHLGLDLRSVLYPSPGAAAEDAAALLRRMSVGQPAVFIVEYALARYWMRLGITPAAVVGHSLGAYAAACVAGVLSLPQAVELVVGRGKLLDSLPSGAMLAIPLPERDIEPLLGDELSLAVINGPAQSVVSGPVAAIERLQDRLTREGVDARRLNISTAGHSSLVDSIVPDFKDEVAQTVLCDPIIPLLSDTTGTWTAPGELTEPGYWTTHLRTTVRFSDALAVLLDAPERVLLEVGPGRTLATLARQHPGLGEHHEVVHSLPHPMDGSSDLASLLTAAGRLWLAGVPISWPGLSVGQRRGKVRLPTYPFQRQRFLVEPLDGVGRSASTTLDAPAWVGVEPATLAQPIDAGERAVEDDAETEVERTLKAIFRRVLGVTRLTRHDSFFDLGGDSLIAAQLLGMMSKSFSIEVPARTIYEAPTVADLATLVEAWRGRQVDEMPCGREDPEWASVSARWLACRERHPEAKYRLYCFPHSGGSAGEFVRWADELPEVEVLGVQLPGRGARLHEPAFTRMGPLVDAVVAEVDFRGPFAFFGHSLGALVAFEVARALRASARRQPDRLFVSACPAPHLPRIDPPIHQLPDDELAAWIDHEYGSLPAEIIQKPDVLRMVLPAHRSDFELVETYEYQAGEPLDRPLTVIGGTEDELTESELAAWGRHTAARWDVERLPGGHFYLREQRDRLLHLVRDRLQLSPTCSGRDCPTDGVTGSDTPSLLGGKDRQ
jgi:phthiocerol/phenolphthiocerol synthesis type-I polyketide synthase E